ncbi:hypothetical protein FACS189459_2020 [Bacilli bacterium]|nr:hypothetical protein FACS189459_2020 [Bacilli bacterium]
MLPQSIKSYASGIEDSWYCSEFAYAAFFNGAHVSINNDDYLKNSDVFSQPGYTPDNL